MSIAELLSAPHEPYRDNFVDAVRAVVQKRGEATIDDVKAAMLENAAWPRFFEDVELDNNFVSDKMARSAMTELGHEAGFEYDRQADVLVLRRKPVTVRTISKKPGRYGYSSGVREVRVSPTRERYVSPSRTQNEDQNLTRRRTIEVIEEKEKPEVVYRSEVDTPVGRSPTARRPVYAQEPVEREVIISRGNPSRVTQIYPETRQEMVDLGLSDDDIAP